MLLLRRCFAATFRHALSYFRRHYFRCHCRCFAFDAAYAAAIAMLVRFTLMIFRFRHIAAATPHAA